MANTELLRVNKLVKHFHTPAGVLRTFRFRSMRGKPLALSVNPVAVSLRSGDAFCVCMNLPPEKYSTRERIF